MNDIVKWIVDNWMVIGPSVLLIGDIICGALPDKWVPYIGGTRRLLLRVIKAITAPPRGIATAGMLLALLLALAVGLLSGFVG